jgi:hypothetical protein
MIRRVIFGALLALPTVFASAADSNGLVEGKLQLKSAGALAFGPNGILFVGDSTRATVFAIDTKDSKPSDKSAINAKGIGAAIAGMLGVEENQILIVDMAVNPISGRVYLSVARGRGPDAQVLILRHDGIGEIEELSLESVAFAESKLPNAPAAGGTGRRNLRSQSITDLEYHDGRIFIAGLSNEEFASTLRSIPFPFKGVNGGTAIEIFHGAHGRFETRSPVRTFTFYEIAKEAHILAAYTCTPLVKFPVSSLDVGEKVRGTTIAELGNRNRPLDMVAYQQGGKDYILLANSARGMMKISTDGMDRKEGIEERISGKSGQSYETLENLKGVMQLAQLDAKRAIVLIEDENGQHLKTIDLP